MLCCQPMASKKSSSSAVDRGRKAESKRMTAQGVAESKARLKVIAAQKKMNPGIGTVVPKKQEKQLKKFLKKYGK